MTRYLPRYYRMIPAQTARDDAAGLTPPYPDHNLLTLHSEQFLTSHQQPPHQSYHQDHTLMVR
jgi:hypothetical protein